MKPVKRNRKTSMKKEVGQMRLLQRFTWTLILAGLLLCGVVYAQPVLQSATYKQHENLLEVVFDSAVRVTENDILFDKLTISDGATSVSLTGGDILNSTNTATTVQIALIYGKVLDSYMAPNAQGQLNEVYCWGNTTENIEAIDAAFDGSSPLTFSFTANAFIGSDYTSIPASEVTLTYMPETDDIHIVSAAYSADDNVLTLTFNTTMQYDLLPEDLAERIEGLPNTPTWLGPGNGLLDIIDNEDRNGNGVLDMESNARINNVFIYDGLGNEFPFSGSRGVLDIVASDNSVLQYRLNRTDRALVEALDFNSTKLRFSDYSFLDVNYNPASEAVDIPVTMTPELDPLLLSDASYDINTNVLTVWFNHTLDADSLMGQGGYLSLSKFKIVPWDVAGGFFLEGGSPRFIDSNTGIEVDLEQVAAQNVEYWLEQYPDSTVSVSLGKNAVYDEVNNGNHLTSFPLTIIEEDPEFRNRAPQALSASYDAYTNILTISFDVRVERETVCDGVHLVNNNGIHTLSADCEFERVEGTEGSNTGIAITFTQADAITYELDDMRDNSTLSIDAYTVVSQREYNGNKAATDIPLEYIDNPYPAVPTYVWYGFKEGQLHVQTSQLTDPSLVDFTKLTYNGVVLETPAGTELLEDGTIVATLSDANVEALNALTDADKIDPVLQIGADFIDNNDGVFSSAFSDIHDKTMIYAPEYDDSVEVLVGWGRSYYVISFEGFPTETRAVPSSIRAISPHATWYVANDQWIAYDGNNGEVPLKEAELDSAVIHFEESTPMNANSGAWQQVADLYAGDNTDIIDKATFVLVDIFDEWGLARNNTSDALWKHGYYNPDDLNPMDGENEYSNEADIIFVDSHPQNFMMGDVSNWLDDSDVWNTSGDEVDWGRNAITNMFAEWTTYKLDKFEDRWIRVGLAYMAEFLINQQPEFYGDEPADGFPGGRDITEYPNQFNSSTNLELLSSRTYDQYTYSFFLYLWEKYGGDEVLRTIAQSPRVGPEGIDMVLENYLGELASDDWRRLRWGDSGQIMRGILTDYATAILMDTTNGNDNGVFNFDNINTRNKIRGSRMEWKSTNAPPYGHTAFEWGFRYYYTVYDLPEENPMITNPSGGVVNFFAGEDAGDMFIRKLNIANASTQSADLGKSYTTQDFTLDEKNSGSVPMSDPDMQWVFGPDTTAGEFPMWAVIVVGGRGEFSISHQDSPSSFIRLFASQNPAISQKLDLYVITELELFNAEKNEAPIIWASSSADGSDTLSIFSEPDNYLTTHIATDASNLTLYHNSSWVETEGTVYWFLDGFYVNGERIDGESISVGTSRLPAGGNGLLELGESFSLQTSSHALQRPLYAMVTEISASDNINSYDQYVDESLLASIHELKSVSPVFNVSPANVIFDDPVMISLEVDKIAAEGQDVGVYSYINDSWVYVGGTLSDDGSRIYARVDRTGKYRALAGDHGDVPAELLIPDSYSLHQNYPNPFNPVTTIQFDTPQTGHVSLIVYDVLGREVSRLVDREMKYGTHRVAWNSSSGKGVPVASGVYFVRMQSGDFSSVRKMVLVH